MTPEILFSIVNTAIMPAWLLLVFAPNWQWTKKLVRSGGVSFVFALVYIVLAIIYFPGSDGSFSDLAGVSQLFSNPYLLIAGWVHYLVFDLLVGVWIVKNAQENNIPHGWIVPSLFFTLMLGPIGWGSYMVLRSIKNR